MNTSIDVDGRLMPCFLAKPASNKPRPAVIVLQEIFGLNSEIKRIASLIAQTGYVALAPNFFHRTDPDFEAAYTSEGAELGIEAATAVTIPNLIRDIRAATDWLKARSYVRGDRIGVWGFCMGSSAAFVASTLSGVTCAICFYGAQIARPWRSGEPPALEYAGAVQAPLLLVFGGKDESIPPEAVAEIRETLTRLGKQHEIHVYPNCDHAFFRHGGSDRNSTDVADAWTRVKSMFAAELG